MAEMLKPNRRCSNLNNALLLSKITQNKEISDKNKKSEASHKHNKNKGGDTKVFKNYLITFFKNWKTCLSQPVFKKYNDPNSFK